MNFCTTLYSGNTRISTNGLLEVYVTEIQHKKSDTRDVGLYHLWKQITVNEKAIKLEDLTVSSCLTLPTPFIGSVVISKGAYFIDERGYLCDRISVCLPERKFYFGVMFVTLNGSPLIVMSL